MSWNAHLSTEAIAIAMAGCWNATSRNSVQAVAPLAPPSVEPCLRIGKRHTPSGDWKDRHFGTDFNACGNAHAVAIAEGEVSSVYIGDKGTLVVIYHTRANGYVVRAQYSHLNDVKLREGDWVKRGQSLGQIWTPQTRPDRRPDWSPHVHLSLLGGVPLELLDPLKFVEDCLSTSVEDHWVYPVSC